MRRLALIVAGGFAAALCSRVLAYTPPSGFAKSGSPFSASAIAIAPDGKVAVGTDSFSGGASVSVYASLASVGGAPLQTYTSASWKFIGGLDFADSNTLVFGENGPTDTLYKASLASPTAVALAPAGSMPAVGDVRIHGSTVYAVAANGPGANILYSIPLAGGSPSTLLSGFGTGYAGGVEIDPSGNFLIADSNDPDFLGNPGQVLRYDSALAPLAPIDLSPGLGQGAFDLVLDAESDLIVSTGSTLTLIPHGTTTPQPFGQFSPFDFPTALAFGGGTFEPGSGSGTLLVSGFTDEAFGGAFAITPVPAPAACAAGAALLALTLATLRRREMR